MNLLPAIAHAFGVDPAVLQRKVDAYESRECRLCESTGKVGAVPCPLCGDRLTLIERRHEEAGRGDADKDWLIEQVKRLRSELSAVEAALAEALNSGRGVYQP